MSGFDQKCPFCDADMDCRRHWDYETEYNIECRACDKLVHISVRMTPEFTTSKPVCGKCNKVEIQSGSYCPECRAEIEANRVGLDRHGRKLVR